jgi:lipoprotein NlpD
MRLAQQWMLLAVLTSALSGCSGMLRWDDSGGKRPVTAARAPRGERAGAGQYTVQAGDTLYSIAFRNQLDFRDVAAWNRINAGYRIYPGQVLRLRPPTEGSSPPAQRPSASRPTPAPAGEPPDATIASSPPSIVPAAELERYYDWQWPLRGAIAKHYAPDTGAKGLDIEGELGQPVIAAAPGRVVYSGSGLKGYGELVIIKHDETYLSAYGYNRRRLVEEGDLVAAGQAVAELGLGPAQRPLLHFEIRSHGKPIDPLTALPKTSK